MGRNETKPTSCCGLCLDIHTSCCNMNSLMYFTVRITHSFLSFDLTSNTQRWVSVNESPRSFIDTFPPLEHNRYEICDSLYKRSPLCILWERLVKEVITSGRRRMKNLCLNIAQCSVRSVCCIIRDLKGQSQNKLKYCCEIGTFKIFEVG